MAEADGITFLTLRQIECNIPEDVNRAQAVTSNVLVAIVSRCLYLITEGDAQFPTDLPPSVAARHRLCQGLGKKFKELGYPNPCGYNNFLCESGACPCGRCDGAHLRSSFCDRRPE